MNWAGIRTHAPYLQPNGVIVVRETHNGRDDRWREWCVLPPTDEQLAEWPLRLLDVEAA